MNAERIEMHQNASFQAIRKVFGLTKKQVELLQQLYLIPEKEICINSLVLELDSERSQVQKYLLRLKKKGLVKRKKITLNEFHQRCQIHNIENLDSSHTHGSLYLYRPIDPQKLMDNFKKRIESWEDSIERFFDEYQ